MRCISGGAAILATVALVACSDSRFMRVGLAPLSSDGIPAYQQVDDSVQLVATEWKNQLFGAAEPSANSVDASDRFEWSSSNPIVAEVRASGWLITHVAGDVVITVRGRSSAYSQGVSVCSRDTRLRIEPHDPVIDLHDTITVRVSMLQPSGAECGHVDFGPFAPQVGSGTQGLEPIFSLPNRWRAIRAGTYWYTSYFPFANKILRDSIFVTIR
jgi:hypothetical protein